MIRHQLTTELTLAALVLSTVGGCLLRKETITVTRDGAVEYAIEYTGKAEDFTTADALPSEKSGWIISTTIEKENDKETYEQRSERRFAPREELPHGYAAGDDPDADLYLQFPTTVRIERRQEGTYFHFRRVYTPRRWAYVQYGEEVFVDKNMKELGEKPTEELTDDEQLQLIKAFAAVEAFKQLEFAQSALAECEPDLEPEYRLRARQALLAVYKEDSEFFERIIDLCLQAPEDQRGACFGREAERILAEGHKAFGESLRNDAGFPTARIERFERAFERARRYHQITSELGGHQFEIEVRMPGTIVAHNGDDAEHEDGMSVVSWKFDGKAFRDRPHELLAITRVTDDAVKSPVDAHGR